MFPLVVNKLLNASHKLDVLNGKISLVNRFLRTRLITLRGRMKPRKKKKNQCLTLTTTKKLPLESLCFPQNVAYQNFGLSFHLS